MRTKIQSLILLSGFMFAGFASAAALADGASKFLGNITTNFQDAQVRANYGTLWNQITAENECKWGSIEYNQGSYDFTGCDRAYNWAKENGGHFKFHALVWGGQYPGWLRNLNADDTKKAITAWFDRVAAQYPDLEMIDVVNEAIRWTDQNGKIGYNSGYLETNIIEALGGDNNGDYKFVITAFQMARQRWPKAILIYNDYNTFRWAIDAGIALVNTIKAAGPNLIDAYGQQAHDLGDMDVTEFKAALKKIHDGVGIPLFITEYDIGTNDDALQKQRYSEQITEFMNAEYVAGITLWGYIFGSTWLSERDANGNVITAGWSGIIKNGVDRPAMTWLKDFMSKNKGVNTTGLLGPSAPDTVPQAAYKGAIAIPGTVEAENYDVGGQNQSYFDSDVANQGNVYRQDRVDIVTIPSGNAVGYTTAGEWLEYTVSVATAGIFDFEASAASGLDGSSFQLFMDDQAITDTIQVTNGGNWDTYHAVTGTTTTALAAGSHILKIAFTGSYANIDNIKLTASIPTKLAEIKANLARGTQGFEVYSIKGIYLNSIRANSISDLKAQMQKSSLKSGVYLVRNKNTSKLLICIHK